MSQTCRAVSYEQYFDELLGSLHLRLIDLANEYGWRPGDTVRLVFHIFKPIKNTEVDVVAELIKRFSDYDIKFAFVTVALNQPFILFDNDPQQQRGRGYYVPTRMTNFVLDDLSCLIQLRGRDEIKNARHGFGRADIERAMLDLALEVGARHRRPAAFRPDLVAHALVVVEQSNRGDVGQA